MKRTDGRGPEALRDITITRDYIEHAEGSCLITVGQTWVICTATVEERTPVWLRGSAQGWITAEYAMLPRATIDRTPRESATGRVSGRSQEIKRLIGRSLRATVDLFALPDLTITIDCDVIKADGGTRTAAITGGYVALYDALRFLQRKGRITDIPVDDFVAAISVGIVEGTPMVDLTFEEDFDASVDMNIVMTGQHGIIEIQGTAEKGSFTRTELDSLVDLAAGGIDQIVAVQRRVLFDGGETSSR